MSSQRNWNLAWFAAVAFVVIFGLGEFSGWVRSAWAGNGWWGIDLQLDLDAAARMARGAPIYAEPRFLYSPLFALLVRPLLDLSFDVASLGLAALKFALAGTAVLAFTRGWRPAQRAMAFAALTCSLPFLHDLMLGNVNVLIAASIAFAMLARPRTWSGVPLGLALALFAKPLIFPVLLWLLVWRPRVFATTVATALGGTVLGLAITGPDAYLQWISTLAFGVHMASPFAGNHGITALVPQLWLPVAAIVGLSLLVVLVKRGPITGLTWAATAGLLIAPYTGTYAALPVIVALPLLGPLAPGVALAIVAVSPIATTHPLPFYAAAILIAALRLREPEVTRVGRTDLDWGAAKGGARAGS